MFPQSIFRCFFGQKMRVSSIPNAPLPRSCSTPQAKPETRPSTEWQAMGLDGIEEVIVPHRKRHPVVRDGWETATHQRVIIKQYAAVATARQEMAITQNLDHPNIVRAIRILELPKSASAIIVTPLAPGVPLACAGVMVGFRRVLFDCLDVLACIHRQGVIHHDLHHENIITDGSSGYIIDFDGSERSTAKFKRDADLAKLLRSFSTHVGADSRAAFANFCDSRLIRRWGSHVPDRTRLRRQSFFAQLSLQDSAP